jgi:hypothetical protein
MRLDALCAFGSGVRVKAAHAVLSGAVPAATLTPPNRGTLVHDDSRRTESFSACA